MPKLKDLTGLRFGRLVVLSFNHRQGKYYYWLCKCDCGTEKLVAGGCLRGGNSKSCGCLQRETRVFANTTHGMSHTKEHDTWCDIKKRCGNPNNSHYESYGGRGIKVCDRWRESFENFYADMGSCPKGFSIERVNVNGNYEPSNCKWISMKDQMKNLQKSRYLEYNGKRMIMADWARDFGIRPNDIAYRLKKQSFESLARYYTSPL